MIEMHSWASHEAPLLAKNKTASSMSRSTIYAGMVMLGVVALVAVAFTREDISNIFPATQEKLAQASMCQNLNAQEYTAKARADCITNLPGLTFKPNFKSFSGYLPVSSDNKKEIFYWFVESQDNPSKDPLVFWTNGGPGCSGLGGLLSEHGPYWVYNDLKLRPNKQSINKFANVVYFEGPVGVGFSAPAKGDGPVLGDVQTARDNAAMIRSFITKFPKYKNHDVYIASESYGGHYTPTLAVELLEGNDKKVKPHVNFKGLIVGNPFVNWWSNRRGSMNAYFGHGLVKLPVSDDWNTHCDKDISQVNMKECNKLYVQISKQLGHLDPYALDFTYCPTDSLENGNQNVHQSEHKRLQKKMIHEALQKIVKVEDKLNYVACADNYIGSYLNKPNVQKALHAKKVKWDMCSNPVFKHWPTQSWAFPMEKIYQKLAASGRIKILVYSGDDDSVCSTYSSQLWLWRLGFPVDTKADWKPWYMEDQLGGYHTRFLSSDKSKTALDFVTIHTAGHMVPATQPKRAFQVYQRFFHAKPDENIELGDGFW